MCLLISEGGGPVRPPCTSEDPRSTHIPHGSAALQGPGRLVRSVPRVLAGPWSLPLTLLGLGFLFCR